MGCIALQGGWVGEKVLTQNPGCMQRQALSPLHLRQGEGGEREQGSVLPGEKSQQGRGQLPVHLQEGAGGGGAGL